ncbi:MAG: WecB/TagA/CpsF family glycosyltransferase [Chloroflexi bacterium]|nr:WecB/TagA/CpsF family glycosyltransferase [Chloroflexota bacterium]
MTHRVNLLGVQIDAVEREAALSMVERAIISRRPHQVVTINVDFLKLAKQDSAYRHLLNTADLAVADGMPLVWASRMLGVPLPERITGMDIVCGLASRARHARYRFYLLGAAPGVAERAGAVLEERYPGAEVCGAYAPPFGSFSTSENDKMVELIQAARPDVLLVAFGAPRQDIWIREYMTRLAVPVSIGVGGTLNFLAGNIRRAPSWMQEAGLEWLFRLSQEPGRLWRRYLFGDLPIFLELLTEPLAFEEPELDPLERGTALSSSPAVSYRQR